MSLIINASRLAALFVVGIFFAVNGHAQTILSGNISGTWSPSGDPFIITDNATVQSGQMLTIQPNVTVWIASGVSITVNGGIQALGTTSQHITFQAPINSQYWNTISVNNSLTNVFNYCDFSNATNALAFVGTSSNQVNYCTFTNIMNIALAFNNQSGNEVLFSSFQNLSNGIAMAANGVGGGNNGTLTANIANCSFSNCWGQAVSGVGNGNAGNGWSYNGSILVVMQNCSFSSVGIGCTFNIYGANFYYFNYGYGNGNVQLMDNLFNNVTNSAISLTSGGDSLSSPATLVNNIILNASNGMVFQDPWDATVLDNIFEGCTNAVQVNGALSRSVEYNDFYDNATNFIGYPSDYGTIIFANRNGTPCDLLFNIYQNPDFVASNNFDLQTNSPCVGAGTPDPAYMDVSFPPSQGTNFPDLGIYGGPLAANWLPVISSPSPLSLSVAPALRLTCNNVSAGGTYQIQSSPDLMTWTDYGSPFYIDVTTNLVKYVDATNGAGFFRLQNLQ
jgi:hypothetical protein